MTPTRLRKTQLMAAACLVTLGFTYCGLLIPVLADKFFHPTTTSVPTPGAIMGQQISMCRIVQYTLSEGDIHEINTKYARIPPSSKEDLAAGQSYPMIVTRVNDNGSINGQLFLDTDCTLWVHNVFEDNWNSDSPVGADRTGKWSWPPRT